MRTALQPGDLGAIVTMHGTLHGRIRLRRDLYQRTGFVRGESAPARRWGVDVVEEKHELLLPPLVR